MDLVIWSEMESLLNLFCSVVYVIVYLKNCEICDVNSLLFSLLLLLLQLDFQQEMSLPGLWFSPKNVTYSPERLMWVFCFFFHYTFFGWSKPSCCELKVPALCLYKSSCCKASAAVAQVLYILLLCP
ncbi:hypothetical protein NL108_007551 [Boleophthalmus pectinirostris]|nr:hypothetical protein NL108_007551 [Boleophthalmus pectinirostris]